MCTPNVSFVNVAYQDNMGLSFGLNTSGLIGLGPTNSWETLDLFMNRMQTEKTISQKVFSFMVGTDKQESKMTWGGYDVKRYSMPGSTFKFYECIKDETFWLLRLKNITLNNT